MATNTIILVLSELLSDAGRLTLIADLLASGGEPLLLHGDLHQGNILAAGRAPWLAIDPKGVVGEATYETAALLHNPAEALDVPDPLLGSVQPTAVFYDGVSLVVTSATDPAVFEVLVRSGRSAPMAKTMLVPEAWSKQTVNMPKAWADMYSYCNSVIEPWDGPAALAMTDGRWVCGGLDRNGLRPMRYVVTGDGMLIAGSEAGMVPVDESTIREKGALGPGQMIAVDGGQHLGEIGIGDVGRVAAMARAVMAQLSGFIFGCVGVSRILTSSTVVRPPRPCAPMPSALTFS